MNPKKTTRNNDMEGLNENLAGPIFIIFRPKRNMKNAYIAGSLLHTDKEHWKFYEEIAAVAQKHGFEPYVPHIHTALGKDVHSQERGIEPDPVFVYNKNKQAVENASVIIAEVTNISTGTGIELGMALLLKKRIICLCHKDAKITRMVRGPVSMGLAELILYENREECLEKLSEKLLEMSS